MVKKTVYFFVIVALFIATSAGEALASSPEHPECWGAVTSQRAVAVGDMGEHSSGQDEPRAGLGNAVKLFGFDHISEFGSFLAEIDGIDETHCPG